MGIRKTHTNGHDIGRRHALKRLGLGFGFTLIAAPSLIRYTRAAEQIVTRDPGGDWNKAATEAFYKPFKAETGVDVISVTAGPDPIAQVQAMVQAKTYTWDMLNATTLTQAILGNSGLLEEINWNAKEYSDIPKALRTPWIMPTDIFSSVFSYRTDKVKTAPKSWADVFDPKAGHRLSLRKAPFDTLEEALLADGVPPGRLYPLDVDRAFKVLDRVKEKVAVWWASGAQATQLLRSGEVDVCATFNSRVQTAIDDGAPVKIDWTQGIYAVEGWAILKGTPKAETAQRFARFCADPERQALFAKYVTFGPTNPKAFASIEVERAKILPTNPDHLGQMVMQSGEYWVANQARLIEKFNAWLLS